MKIRLLPSVALALAAGCGGAPRHATLALFVTDAPVPFDRVHSARISIDRISIDAGPGALGKPIVLYAGEPISVELCGLRNGVVRQLLGQDLPLETYRRLRLHLCGAELELSDGRRFTSTDGSLAMPTAGAGGSEVAIEAQPTLVQGQESRLVLDIDLPRSFVPENPGDLAQATRVRLDPRIHVLAPGRTGAIRGLVSTADAQGQPVPVADATLYFLPSGTEDLNLAAATTGSDADGSFASLDLPPGTYEVVAAKGGALVRHSACLVRVGGYTLVELSLP